MDGWQAVRPKVEIVYVPSIFIFRFAALVRSIALSQDSKL